MYRFAWAAVAALALVGSASAGPLEIGAKAPEFNSLECATSGKHCSMADLKGKDVLVVVFTCNHCPVAKAYEGRMMDLAKTYGGKDGKVGVVAINVSEISDDGLSAMKSRAKEKGYTFAYLFDPSQKTGRDFGATRTPEWFVFDKERKLVYHGAFDDNMKADEAKQAYVVDAVKAALKGEKPAKTSTKPSGCGIQYKKKS